MPFVYRYKDMLSERYKYIGIVKADGVPSLEARIKQHENDDWFTTSKWYIDYMTTANVAEAEAIESHLISLYHAEFNKAKANWGTCSFIDIDDTLFVPFAMIDPKEKYQNQINKLKARIETLKSLERERKKKTAEPVKVFSFRGLACDVDQWRLYASIRGVKVDEIGSAAMQEYIKRHPLSAEEKALFYKRIEKETPEC